jgi:hypothetical protein
MSLGLSQVACDRARICARDARGCGADNSTHHANVGRRGRLFERPAIPTAFAPLRSNVIMFARGKAKYPGVRNIPWQHLTREVTYGTSERVKSDYSQSMPRGCVW